MADEAEREYKKMSERITEGREAMKVNLPLSAITFHMSDPILSQMLSHYHYLI